MNLIPKHSRLWILFLFIPIVGCSQVSKKIREYDRLFQFSLLPGISTNGIYSASFRNRFSLNLFGGISAGNRILEIGLISNVNIKNSTGIQIAGIANIVGTNAFVNLSQSEERELIIKEGFKSDSKGIQVAGLINYVRDNATGIQFAGGFNLIGYDFKGTQFAGIGNVVGEQGQGLQFAGLFNIAHESMGGFQITTLLNYTHGQLAGLQLALINKNGSMDGRKSTPPTRGRSLQLGLLNMSKAMDGVQIGLINFGGKPRGVQIGLINFFKKYGSKENVKMGTPIGLLNIGSRGSVFRLYYNELFTTNAEYTTGNCLNCSYVMGSEMPYNDNYKIYNQNALILGYDHSLQTWGFGYGFERILYNKVSMEPIPPNEKRMIGYGIKFLHLNKEMKIDQDFNLLSKLHVEYGKRWKGKRYFFVSASVNYFLLEEEAVIKDYHIKSAVITTGKFFDLNSFIWPGYAIGLQI
ncbi:MAG: hypothetical protein ABI663_02750 [Chryseolinea sp.]